MAKTDLGRLPKIAVFVLIFFSNLFSSSVYIPRAFSFSLLKNGAKRFLFLFFFLNIHNFSTY